ncbi:hypothetical protein PGT21_037151 [Puccinia graminis f. sp. tritici]|nr:hypothetical protein PGTUg99_010873 [Puccinia graminis f. sp. tritici]KAA1084669.1 hypothetical protein PGT21_033907 [Puccinia graminis f. sp. tritici]KAA1120097.1 hypothetical protein PGT21_037151 [Puccinia graminis f. sp. tritici]
MLLDDDEDEIELPSHGGSHPGKQPNRPRDFEGSYNKLMQHYFSAQPLYNEEIFRRRFRMGICRLNRAVPSFNSRPLTLVLNAQLIRIESTETVALQSKHRAIQRKSPPHGIP